MKVNSLFDAQNLSGAAVGERGDSRESFRDGTLFECRPRRVPMLFAWAGLLSALAAVFLIAQCHMWSAQGAVSSIVGRRLAGSNDDEDQEGSPSQICQGFSGEPETAAGQETSYPMRSAGGQEQAAAAAGTEQRPHKKKRKKRYLDEDEQEDAPEAKLGKLSGSTGAASDQFLVRPQEEAEQALLPQLPSREEERRAFENDVFTALGIPEAWNLSDYSPGWEHLGLFDNVQQSYLEEWHTDFDDVWFPTHTPEALGEQQADKIQPLHAKEQDDRASSAEPGMHEVALGVEGHLPEAWASQQAVAAEAPPFGFSGDEDDSPDLTDEICSMLGPSNSSCHSSSEQSGDLLEDELQLDTLGILLKESGLLEDLKMGLKGPSTSSFASEVLCDPQSVEKESSAASQLEEYVASGPSLPETSHSSEDSRSWGSASSAVFSVGGAASEGQSSSSPGNDQSEARVESQPLKHHLFYRLPIAEPPEQDKMDNEMAPSFWAMPRLSLAGALRPVQLLLNKEYLNAKEARELIIASRTLLRFAFTLAAPIVTRHPAHLCTQLGRRFLVADAMRSLELVLGSHFQRSYVWDDVKRKLLAPPVHWKRRPLPAVLRGTREEQVELMLRAMEKYRLGERPSPQTVVYLKRELLCYCDSPPAFKKGDWEPWREDERNSGDLR
ncbi:hypothetical protein Esti_000426 [Eimeria stiedai]